MKRHPFHQWVAASGPRRQIWRTLLGCLVVLLVWTVWSLGVTFLAAGAGMVDLRQLSGAAPDGDSPLGYVQAAVLLGVVMVTFWGLWLGLWLALRLLHRRSLLSVLSHDRRISLAQFGVGVALALGYLMLSLVWSMMFASPPRRSDVDLGQWLVGLAPLAGLVLLQSAGEEIVFRGYLPQQLAARWAHPLCWGLLPALVFGLAHGLTGDGALSLYYMTAASLMGLVMMAMVWRTGSIAAAIGFHFANNIGALLTVSVAGVAPPVSLWAWRPADALEGASADILMLGLMLAFVLSPWAPLPKGQALRRKDSRAAP